MANPLTLGLFSIGPTEVIVVLVVALLIFGRRLPEVARSLGKGIIEFKKGLREDDFLATDTDEEPNSEQEQEKD